MKNKKLILLPLLCLLLGTGASANDFLGINKKKKKAKTEQAKADSAAKKKETEYDKLFKKKHDTAQGMITLHRMDGKLYFELPVTLLDREMLIGSTVTAVSDNGNAVVGSKPTEPMHVLFTRNKTHVQLRKVNTDYISSDSRIDSALRMSSISPILVNAKIAAYNRDSTALVFEMTSFFVSDNKELTPFDSNSLYSNFKRTESFKSDLSYISGIKAFEDNVSIRSVLSYTYSLADRNGRELRKDSPYTAEMTRSIMLLKEKPYRPRMADYRIGVFFTGRNRLGTDSHTTAPVYYANRWDLQPSDTAAWLRGEKVRPVKPIVFYIDNTFPDKWKSYILEGVNQWQETFEKIGFKEAIIAREFPSDDPEFDPDNIKYSCVRYAPINIRNAMGPSWVDPRSGEIITASVYLYHDAIKLINNWLFVQTAPADPDVRKVKIPEEITGDALRYVVAHEIGHCLGFMHNMSGSSVVAVDSLRSPSYTQKHGTTTSIMDYARFNYVAQPGDKERGVKLTPPRFGIYDDYLVRWTYTPVPEAASVEAERVITTQWITDSVKANPVYRYGKQQVYGTVDPRSQMEDLGDDPIRATQYGIKNLKYLVSNLDNWITQDDEDYEFRQEVFLGAVEQLAMYVEHVASNVGGYFLNEVKQDDTLPRFANIPAARQRAALDYLFTIYKDLEWLDNKKLLSKFPVSGSPRALIEEYIARRIFITPFKVATYENVVPGNTFKYPEALSMIYDFVWKPTITGRKLSRQEMELQKNYLYTMMESMQFKTPRTASAKEAGIASLGAIDKIQTCLEPEMSRHRTPWGSYEDSTVGHNPVAGFEWIPRGLFKISKLSGADIYNIITKVQQLLKQRVGSSSGETRMHYQLLLRDIEAGVK